jgi:hypothetical protein
MSRRRGQPYGADFAHSTDRERPIRPNVITNSGDREHVLAVAEQAVASDAVWWRSGATDG